MGVLDELKQASERRRHDLSESEEALRQRELAYQRQVRPAMQSILRYLNEMTEHLNFLKPDVVLRYAVPGYGDVTGLTQEEYRLSVDSSEQPHQIKLWFNCNLPDALVFSVKPRESAEETRKFLELQRLRFSEWPLRDMFHQLVGLGFEVQFHVPVVFLISADKESGLINIKSINFEGFEVVRDAFRPEAIDDKWLEDLGNYLLRRNANLRSLQISESERSSIRQRLELEQMERQQDLAEAERRAAQAAEQERERRLSTRLLRLVQQTRRNLLD